MSEIENPRNSPTVAPPNPVDYFPSFDKSNQILKVLHDIPIEKLRQGGYTKFEIERALGEYSSELLYKKLVRNIKSTSKKRSVRSIKNELNSLQKAGQIEALELEDSCRYKLSSNTLFYIHSLYPPVLKHNTLTGNHNKIAPFVTISFPGTLVLDEIILVPGSLILNGEYGVLLGQPAIVLPIPNFIAVHATVSKSVNTTISTYESFPDSYTSFSELSRLSGPLIPHSKSPAGDFKFKLSKVLELFKEKLTSYINKSGQKIGYHVNFQVRSQIPPCNGLGSSGALCVALALLLDRIINSTESLSLKSLRNNDIKVLFENGDQKVKEVFLNAVDFEKIIHGETSGVGPFASLLGTDCFTPLRYCLGDKPNESGSFIMSEVLERWKAGLSDRLSLNCERGTSKARELLANNMGIAAVYTTQSRHSLCTTIGDPKYIKALKREDCRRDFLNVTEKLWKNLCKYDNGDSLEDDINDVITSINLFGGYEEGYLKMLRAENEAIPRDLIYKMRGVGLGAKYTGSGFGGDIVLVGPREKVTNFLIPNYFPVHFTNVNLNYKSNKIDIETHPNIVPKEDFLAKLLPDFMSRGNRV